MGYLFLDMSQFENIIKNHWIQFVGLIFMAGGAWSRFIIMEHDVQAMEEKMKIEIRVIEERLDKKIKLINQLEKRIDKLEKCGD